MPATAPASKVWPSSTSSSTLCESVSSTFDSPWVSPDCPAECAPRPLRVDGASTSEDVTSGDRRMVWTVRFGRGRLLDRGTIFFRAIARRSLPDFLTGDFFLRVGFFFLVMRRSLPPRTGIALLVTPSPGGPGTLRCGSPISRPTICGPLASGGRAEGEPDRGPEAGDARRGFQAAGQRVCGSTRVGSGEWSIRWPRRRLLTDGDNIN